MLFLLTEVLLVTLIPASIIQGSSYNLEEQADGKNIENSESDTYNAILQQFYPTTTEASPQPRLFTMPRMISDELEETETTTTTPFSKHNNNNNVLENEPVIPIKRAINQNPVLKSKEYTGKSITVELPSTSLSAKSGIKDSKQSFIFGSTSSQGGIINKNSIIFEDNTSKNPDRGTGNGIEKKPICNDTQVLIQSKCYDLFRQGPCSNTNEWLIEVNDIPTCAKRSCPSPKVPFKGRCRNPVDLVNNHVQNCPHGMKPYFNRDGTAECHCKPGHIRNLRDGKCYEIYRRGPCGPSQYFALDKTSAKCVTNPCRREDFVCYGSLSCPAIIIEQSDCVMLHSPCNNGNDLIMVDRNTLKVGCLSPEQVDDRIIGNVPPFSCAKGYKRDVNGVCRKTTSFNFS